MTIVVVPRVPYGRLVQGYWLTNILSAVTFLKAADAEALRMSTEEFESGVRLAKAKAERIRQSSVRGECVWRRQTACI